MKNNNINFHFYMYENSRSYLVQRFLEHKLIFNDIQRRNYPQECRSANFNQAKNDAIAQAKNDIHNSITEAQKGVKKCQDALDKASWENITEGQGLVSGQEGDFLAGAIVKGVLHITNVLARSQGGQYVITGLMNGVQKTFIASSDAYKKIYNTVQKKQKEKVSMQSDLGRDNPNKRLLRPAENFTNEAGRTTSLSSTGRTKPISQGGYGKTENEEYIVHGLKGKRLVNLVTKTLHTPRDASVVFPVYVEPLEAHRVLQNAHIPTFNTVRVNDTGTKILSTPLNINGTWAISANNATPHGFNPKSISLVKESIDNLVTEVSLTINKAINHNIKLPPDSIFFLVNKNGSVGHKIGDFDRILMVPVPLIHNAQFQRGEMIELIQANMELYDSIIAVLPKIGIGNSEIFNKIYAKKKRHYDNWINSMH